MERTTLSFIPDAINRSTSRNFTQIPNDLLRDPTISGKAKAILCLLLSNKDGWKSYVVTIGKMMKEGPDAIYSGLAELEERGYLKRSRLRSIKTKRWVGMVWSYTDFPGQFSPLEEYLELLKKHGIEMESPDRENPEMAIPDIENPGLIIPINKNTKDKNPNLLPQQRIMPSQFNQFWDIYPRKVDQGKAKNKWETICSRKNGTRPTLQQITSSITAQCKSDRWQDAKFIPHPTTWLNQQRWLDDPEQMTLRDSPSPHTKPKPTSNRLGYTGQFQNIKSTKINPYKE